MAVTYPPPSPPFIQARNRGGRQDPKAIVIHGTVSSDNRGTARAIAKWWAGPTSPVTSAHYTVDPGEVIQSVGDHTIAFHCGSNTNCIGVELCDEQTGPASRWQDADSQAILRRAARLVAELCLAYGIEAKRPTIAELKSKGKHGIYGHNDSRLAFGNTSHTDPRDFPWAQFLRLVRAEIAKIKAVGVSPNIPPKPSTKRKVFRVLHAPLHGASSTDAEVNRALKREGVTRINFTEGNRRVSWLRKRLAWRVYTGRGIRDSRGKVVDQDIVLVIKRTLGHIAHGTFRVSNAAAPMKLAPPRYITYSVDKSNGQKVATIGFHPNAAVRSAWASERAEEYRKSMEEFEQLVIRLRRQHGKDLDVVVMADMNYIDVADGRHWAPRATFQRLGLKWVDHGVDFVAYSSGLKVIETKIIPPAQNGQDHPWIEVLFQQV